MNRIYKIIQLELYKRGEMLNEILLPAEFDVTSNVASVDNENDNRTIIYDKLWT